jgi:putative hydrolase of the HAD superfamily
MNGNTMKNKIKIIAFDADDTLWVNEPYFQDAEKQFCTFLTM